MAVLAVRPFVSREAKTGCRPTTVACKVLRPFDALKIVICSTAGISYKFSMQCQ